MLVTGSVMTHHQWLWGLDVPRLPEPMKSVPSSTSVASSTKASIHRSTSRTAATSNATKHSYNSNQLITLIWHKRCQLPGAVTSVSLKAPGEEIYMANQCKEHNAEKYI